MTAGLQRLHDLVTYRRSGERWEDVLPYGDATMVDAALWEAVNMGADAVELADAIRTTWDTPTGEQIVD